MKIIPHNEFTLHTRHTPEYVFTQISQETIEKQPLLFGWNHKETFWGHVSMQDFVIHPICKSGTNSFLPQVQGTVQRVPEGSTVHLTMELLPFVQRFLKFWLISACFFLIIGILICLGKGLGTGLPFLLIISGMLLFAFVLTYIAFHYGCKSTVKTLEHILK